MLKNIDCHGCGTSMIKPATLPDHQYLATLYATFLNRENRRGLIQASYGSSKVVAAAGKSLTLNIVNTNKKIDLHSSPTSQNVS